MQLEHLSSIPSLCLFKKPNPWIHFTFKPFFFFLSERNADHINGYHVGSHNPSYLDVRAGLFITYCTLCLFIPLHRSSMTHWSLKCTSVSVVITDKRAAFIHSIRLYLQTTRWEASSMQKIHPDVFFFFALMKNRMIPFWSLNMFSWQLKRQTDRLHHCGPVLEITYRDTIISSAQRH